MHAALGMLLLIFSTCLGFGTYLCVHAEKVEAQNSLTGGTAQVAHDKAAKGKRPRRNVASMSPQGVRLHSAGIDIDPKAWALMRVVASFFAFLIVFVASNNALFGVIAFCAVFFGAAAFIRTKAKKMKLLLAEQLGSALPLVAENVRSGLTPDNAFRAVAKYMEDPLQEELIRVNAEVSYGRPLSEALSNFADRTGNRDINLMATAVAFAIENGGNLSESLDRTAEAVTEKLGMRRHLKAITSGQSSAKWIVAALPWIVTGLFSLINPQFLEFWQSTPGMIVIIVIVVLEAIGIMLMNLFADLKLD